MADNTLSSGSILRPLRSNYGAPPVRWFQASTAVSTARITRGDIVQLDPLVATGSFRIRRDQIASTVVSTGIIGVALASDTFSDAAGTGLSTTVGVKLFGPGNNMLPVAMASKEVEFEVWTISVLASTWIGQPKAFRRNSTLNVWEMDSSNSTNLDMRAIVTEILDTPGDTGGRIAVRFFDRHPTIEASTSGTYLAFGQ